MDETDAFFTQTIVGAPHSVLLGRRQSLREVNAQGLQVLPNTGETRLSPAWQQWVVLSHACDPVGQPRGRPGLLRRKLERHALLVAIAGLLALFASAVFWGLNAWEVTPWR